ncbi:SDR family oxidoreductase [Halopseudomonas pachastrellae]|jgi:short-subunit dehydrogenase|nr:SDR family oxidoreductase [Halopseudomonas pachastrellae]MED5491821.1 SDR family oxidoreductase [Pseudomonadota bacterium]
MQLSASRVLLTGATGGMGRAIVAALCAQGAQVLVVGRQDQALQALVERNPGLVSCLQADLRHPADRANVLRHAQQMGGINLLINAAGINHFGLFENMQEQGIDDLITTNLSATLQLTHAMLPLLRSQPQSCVVNIGSTFGSIGYPGFSVYCATKFALRGFSEALRRELADTNVGVLYIAPRATRTEMNNAAVEAMNAELQVSMDSPELVAERLVQALDADLREVHLGFPEWLFVRLNGLLPRLVDKALRRQLPTIRHYASPAAHPKEH